MLGTKPACREDGSHCRRLNNIRKRHKEFTL